jgi:hypothetical protein
MWVTLVLIIKKFERIIFLLWQKKLVKAVIPLA